MAQEYAVVKKWKDNPKDFQVLEYFEDILETKKYIKKLEKNPKMFTYEIMKYI